MRPVLKGKRPVLEEKRLTLVLRGGDQSNGRRPKYSIHLLQIDFLQYNRKSPSKKLVEGFLSGAQAWFGDCFHRDSSLLVPYQYYPGFGNSEDTMMQALPISGYT